MDSDAADSHPPMAKRGGGEGGDASPADSGRRTSAPGRVPRTTDLHNYLVYFGFGSDQKFWILTIPGSLSAPLHLGNAFLSLKLLSHSLNKIEKDSDDILKDDEIFVYNIVTSQENMMSNSGRALDQHERTKL